MIGLTKRQYEVLDTIRRLAAQKGYAPSYREIAKAMGLRSAASIHKHVTLLEKKGRIRREAHAIRNLEVIHLSDDQRGLPIVDPAV